MALSPQRCHLLDVRHLRAMSQQATYAIQLFFLGSFVVSLFVWPAKHRRAVLRRDQAVGCVGGGCVLPLLLFVWAVFAAGDIGGPLFWPIIAVELGLFGFAVGTAFYLCPRRKPGA